MHQKHGEQIDRYLERKSTIGVFNPNVIEYKLDLPRDPLLRQQVIKARKEAERERGTIKTSIFNKKALVRQDQ